ncbi:hypothetical protein [Novosphingobium aquimarinum]|uniref:hypothetical protein n=1 Tax=Novosphingobium aquimarinum TaxID=2682494 RepID=UPI0012EB3535|nr:hypothetical protein [Novosphingobium aquimarinum]
MAECPSSRQLVPARNAPDWRKAFLTALAESSNVKASAARAGISPSTAYDARRNDPAFQREWQDALFEGYEHLEMTLLQRLREGEIKPAAGAKRGKRTFDNATAFRLLMLHRESAARAMAQRENRDADAVLASIDAKIDRMRAVKRAGGRIGDAPE